MEGMLLLKPEVSGSFSQFSEWHLQCKLLANILPRVII